MTTPETLPTDPDALLALLLAERARHAAELAAERAGREAEAAGRARAEDQIAQLRQIILDLQRHRFGRRSERLDADQLQLALEDLEQALAALEAAPEAADQAVEVRRARPTRRQVNRGNLPDHLPREEIVVDIADKSCPCCGGALHPIGEDVSQRLDTVPARLRVLVTRRPKYACRSCQEGVVQAPAPARIVEAGLPTEALLASILVSKYADHLPLYRQAQILARQGVDLDRSTLADWVGRAAWYLKPVHERLLAVLKSSAKLFADETPAPVLDPGRGRTKTGQLWAYARDDRPWQGPEPPGVAYVYAPDRKGERPAAHLAGFRGVLQVDGYAGYKALAGTGAVRLAFCWAHARRAFHKLSVAGNAPLADEALRRIAQLYAVEDRVRGRPAEERRTVRQAEAAPKVAALKTWLEAQLGLISGGSTLARAIRYALEHWDGLCLYLDDGRVEIDSNTVERSIRPIALNRKNALFAGSDGGGEHWAVIASLVETCKLNGVDPQAWFTDVLTRLASGHPITRLEELLPWAYAARYQPAVA